MKKVSIHNHFKEQGKYDNSGIAYYIPYTGLAISESHKKQCIEIRVTDPNIKNKDDLPITLGLVYLTPKQFTNDLSLNFIEVHKDHYRKGISKLLVSAIVKYFKSSGYEKLYRTIPGVRCPESFTKYMTKTLDENNIEWYNKK